MKALIINMANASKRRTFQENQLSRLGIPYEIIIATTVADIDENYYQQAGYRWQRPLRREELACTLSHKKAWELTISHNQPYLILEDDAFIAGDIKLLLSQISSTPYDYINLETRARKKKFSENFIKLNEHYALHHLTQDKSGAAGYILWPKGARKLISEFESNGAGLADAMLTHTRKLIKGQVVPAALVQLDMCNHYDLPVPLETVTSISTNQIAKISPRNFAELLNFRYKRVKAQCGIFLNIVFNRGRYEEVLPRSSQFQDSSQSTASEHQGLDD